MLRERAFLSAVQIANAENYYETSAFSRPLQQVPLYLYHQTFTAHFLHHIDCQVVCIILHLKSDDNLARMSLNFKKNAFIVQLLANKHSSNLTIVGVLLHAKGLNREFVRNTDRLLHI